jgi:hypothetical protein
VGQNDTACTAPGTTTNNNGTNIATMSLFHLETRRKSKAPLGTTAVIAIVVGLILTGLNLNRLNLKRASVGTEIRFDDVVEMPQKLPVVDVVEMPQKLPVVDVVELPRELPVVDVVELSRGLPAVDPSSNITTALCCKAMFGSVDLSRVALWVAYYRLLGFDHVFLFHQDIVAHYPGFDKLKSLPYLTLTPIKGKMVEFREKSQKLTNNTSIPYWRFEGHNNQYALERRCFNKHAKHFDWAMIADIDEYLSFNEEMGVKDFIAKYTDDSTISLGFGKKMYTLTARVDKFDSGFGLDMYPFTPGIYCSFSKNFLMKSRKECAGVSGSTKLMVRPQRHSEGIQVHGPRLPSKQHGQIQINTDIARFLEYPFMHQRVNATYREKVDFLVTSGSSLRMTYFNNGYQQHENGTWTIRYDDEPSKWYQYVASRGVDSSPKSLRLGIGTKAATA